MKKLRVLVPVHESLVPPDDPPEGVDLTTVEWKTEWDVTVTLRNLGHEVCVLGIGSELAPLRRVIEEWKPHVVFNLCEEFAGEPAFDHVVVSFLEVLGVAVTGCNSRGLILARDKALSKKILAWHRIASPEFAVYRRGARIHRPKSLPLPALVKSLTYEASRGISGASVVHDDAEFEERVRFVHEKVGTDAIAERYVDGREFYVGVIGNQRLDVLPVWELFLDKLPDRTPKIATEKVKFDAEYQKRHGIMSGRARDLDPALERKLQHICKRAYRSLGLTGYARMDLRVDAEGRAFVLEANPNPQIAYGEDFAESADAAGMPYPDLLMRLIGLAMRGRSLP
jgi:D-alanine-D-alanine ligase